MVTILIVEDDDMVRLLTKIRLGSSYNILDAKDGEEALEILDHEHVDLIVADIQMPKMNGYELVRSLREAGNDIPVIIITAMESFEHKREGFASGAEDYMTKPINYEELTWRIEALLRRARIANEKCINIGKLKIDQSTYSASYDGEPINLTNKEFDLLYKFLSYPNVVFTKQQLMDDIWGFDSETEYGTIKTYISRLRNKLSKCRDVELISIRGLGYKAVIHSTEGAK
ncbi:MAG: response regulator transcription factor [Clostridiales bacterium]|nr:response regulator transcription factor [Clostridiales bacterium]